MWGFFGRISGKLAGRSYRRRIEEALALHRRGEVRPDGLTANGCSTRLEIQWIARNVHPWDRMDPDRKRAEAFVRQTLADTDAALQRLFAALPEIDVIAATVLEADSGDAILAGTVHRAALLKSANLSPGMKLRDCGMEFHSDGFGFEPLKKTDEPHKSLSPPLLF